MDRHFAILPSRRIYFEVQRFRSIAAKPHGRRWIGRYGAGGTEPRPCGGQTIRNGTAYAVTLKLCIEWARTHGASERVYS